MARAAGAYGIRACSSNFSPVGSTKSFDDSIPNFQPVQVDYVKQAANTSMLLEKLGCADAASSESWLLDRLNSVEVAFKMRCDALESRMCVLSTAVYGEGCGFQPQIDALKTKLEAAVGSLHGEMSGAKACLSSLAEGVKICGKGHESLQSGINELWRMLAIDQRGQLASSDPSVDLAPHLQRLIDRVERTCNDLSGHFSEDKSTGKAASERSSTADRAQRSPSGALSHRQTGLVARQQTGLTASRQQTGSIVSDAEIRLNQSPGATLQGWAAPSQQCQNSGAWPAGPLGSSGRESPTSVIVEVVNPMVRREVSTPIVRRDVPSPVVHREMSTSSLWRGPHTRPERRDSLAHRPAVHAEPAPGRPSAGSPSALAAASRSNAVVRQFSPKVTKIGGQERLALV